MPDIRCQIIDNRKESDPGNISELIPARERKKKKVLAGRVLPVLSFSSFPLRQIS